jgi:hypothetical protein
MCGELFLIRSQGGTPKQLTAINAGYFAINGESVLNTGSVASFTSVHFWEGGTVIERGEEEGNTYVRDLRYRQFQRQ